MAHQAVGRRLTRVDAIDKVTGRAKYSSDIRRTNMLEGKILRSKYAHARLLHVDTSRAEKLPGVKAVMTGKDLPPTRIGVFVFDDPMCAREKVRYIGEPVAAVAAIDNDTAVEALDLIRVEYEELPAIFDPIAAMAPDAPIIHEDLTSYKAIIPAQRSGNILNHGRLIRGDVNEGFAEADVVYQAHYTTQAVDHGYLETHEAVAETDNSGKITLWTESHGVFSIRSMVAGGLSLPLSKIRVIGTACGGSFGGKMWAFAEPFCIVLSQKANRPVRIGLSREEEALAGHHRHPAIIDLKTGATTDGRLVAVEGKLILDTGAYDAFGSLSYYRYAYLQGPYRFLNVDLEGHVVYTNNGVHGAVRGPMAPQVLFAIESQMDMMARELNMDPLELRRINAVNDGDLSPTARDAAGPRLRNVGVGESLDRVAAIWKQRKPAKGRITGYGIACGQWATEATAQEGPSSATIKVNEDGTIVLSTGVSELGGGAFTIVAQIAAEELGVPMEDISLVTQDSDATPYESGVGGSRATYRVGTTVKIAAEDARNQLLRLAASKLEANIEDLEMGERRIYVKGSPDKGITFAALAAAAQGSRKGPIIATSTSLRDERLPDPKVAGTSVDNPCYSAHVAEVEVDPDTGAVRVADYLAAHDVGFALHPANVEGQIEGGVTAGIGYGLTEEYIMDKGHPLNTSFSTYRMPTALDVPMVQPLLVERPSNFGPYGAKGVAEPPVIPVAPAIANAVYDAVGVRITDLPLTSEKVLRALREKQHAGV